jgi:hypothetical protein
MDRSTQTPENVVVRFQVSYRYDDGTGHGAYRSFAVTFPSHIFFSRFQRVVTELANADMQSQLALKERSALAEEFCGLLNSAMHQ